MVFSHPISVAVSEQIWRQAKVVCQPVRVRLIDALRNGEELSVGELAGRVGISGFDASKHLGVLLGADVVRQRRVGRHSRYRLAEGDGAMQLYEILMADREARLRAHIEEIE